MEDITRDYSESRTSAFVFQRALLRNQERSSRDLDQPTTPACRRVSGNDARELKHPMIRPRRHDLRAPGSSGCLRIFPWVVSTPVASRLQGAMSRSCGVGVLGICQCLSSHMRSISGYSYPNSRSCARRPTAELRLGVPRMSAELKLG